MARGLQLEGSQDLVLELDGYVVPPVSVWRSVPGPRLLESGVFQNFFEFQDMPSHIPWRPGEGAKVLVYSGIARMPRVDADCGRLPS